MQNFEERKFDKVPFDFSFEYFNVCCRLSFNSCDTYETLYTEMDFSGLLFVLLQASILPCLWKS